MESDYLVLQLVLDGGGGAMGACAGGSKEAGRARTVEQKRYNGVEL